MEEGILYTRHAVYCNATLWRVRLTIVSVEDQSLLNIMSVCIVALSYPACKLHPSSVVLYYCLWTVCLP